MNFTKVEIDMLDGLHCSLKNAIGYAGCLRAELLEHAAKRSGNEEIEELAAEMEELLAVMSGVCEDLEALCSR